MSNLKRCGDPSFYAVPELFECPLCGGEVEIWTDEGKGKCSGCNARFRKDESGGLIEAPRDVTNGLPTHLNPEQSNSPKETVGIREIRERFPLLKSELIRLAVHLGASDAAAVSTNDITVEDELANLCLNPRCENYGLSTSCPPHVSGPAGFRKMLKNYEYAIVLKIDVPTEILLSNARLEIMELLHDIVVAVENAAADAGCPEPKAFAGGGCKQLFCRDYPDCNVVVNGGDCRNPGRARPSMSGYGVNVAKLQEAAGWKMHKITRDTDPNEISMGTVCGLVLVC